MKKEIMNIINNGGTFKLNNAVSLVRELGEWEITETQSDKIDVLAVQIKVVGIKGWYSVNIKSRDYDGIISEVNEAVKKAYSEAANNLCRDFKAGYH